MAMFISWTQCSDIGYAHSAKPHCSLPWASSPKHYDDHSALLVSDLSTPGMYLLK